MTPLPLILSFFFFNDTATTEIYTLSLHDALPISPGRGMAVSIYSKKKEATMKVLQFISLPDQSLKIVMDPKTIMDPWRVSHLKSPIFRKAFPDADKYLDAIEQSFPFLVPDPVIPAADEYPRKLSFEITAALAN